MPIYKAPLDDVRFVLNELFDVGELDPAARPRGAYPRPGRRRARRGGQDSRTGAPAAQPQRRRGGLPARERRGHARPRASRKPTPPSARAAGPGSACDPDYGGQGLPHTVQFVLQEFICSANLGFELYPASATAPTTRCTATARDELKDLYLPKLVDGTWSGTMCLTEPHCGTDLGLLRTKAVPAGDGSYRDHRHQDLHLGRRARPDREHRPPGPGPPARRPAGHQGHQPVPRAEVPARGRRHARCPQRRRLRRHRAQDGDQGLGHLRHELRRARSAGWSGQPHKGMRAMFTMMNAARLGVGIQGLGIAEVSLPERRRPTPATGCRGAR